MWDRRDGLGLSKGGRGGGREKESWSGAPKAMDGNGGSGMVWCSST